MDVEKMKAAGDLEGLMKAVQEGSIDEAGLIGVVNAVGQIGGERAIEWLIGLFPLDNIGKRNAFGLLEAPVGMAAMYAVGRIGEPAVEPLIKALENTSSNAAPVNIRATVAVDTARHVATALGIIKDHRAVGPLIRALACKYYQVRDCARDALEMIGEPAVEPLTKALEDENKHVREGAKKALKRIQKK